MPVTSIIMNITEELSDKAVIVSVNEKRKKNPKFTIQAKKSGILEGNKLEIIEINETQSINTKVEILWTPRETNQST